MEKKKDNELLPVATLSRNVMESYIFATGHQDLSIYSERLLLQLVKAAQCQVNGLNFKDGSAIRQVSIGLLGDAEVEIEAKELLSGTSSTNYSNAKKAVLELMKKPIEHERPIMKNGKPMLDADGKQLYQYEAHNLLNDVYINRKPGTIVVNVNKSTWEAILDFSKGFRRYDLQAAMKFSRTCSLRMYKLISNQERPLTYTIQELREMWGLKDKYANTKDFIKYTVDSAKEELDSCSPWTFDRELIYSRTDDANKGRAGRKAITAIRFFPKHQIRFESTTTTAAQLNPQDILGKVIIDRLVKNIGFSMAEIKANVVLLNTAKKHFDLEQFLIQITPKASRAGNPQGYVVNAIKTHLKEKYGVIIRKNEIVEDKQDTQPTSTYLPKKAPESLNDILSAKNTETQRPQTHPTKGSPKSIGNIFGGLFPQED